MKFIKKIYITFFLILSLFVFSNIAISQTVTADLPELRVLNQAELDELNNMPSVQTYNFKLDKAIYKAGDTVKGTFFIKNDRAYNLPDLKYTVSLAGEYDKRTGLPAMVYDSKSFGPVFLAGSEESKEVSFSYKLPESYAGDNFGIQIKTFTNAGIPLGWNSVLIKINGVSGVLKIDSAYVEVDGKKFSLQEGPTIKEGKKGETHIFVSNPLKKSVSVSGKINIYNRTITGKLLGTYNTEFFEIKSGEKQEFVLDLNKYISEPGVYEGFFIILDKENVTRAQEIKFRYIIWGNIVTIQKVVADKEFVNRGEIVNLDISYTGSPFDITNGETPDQKPMNTKIVLSDLKDNVVANYEGLIDYNKGASVKIPLTATKNADYIKIGLTVYDESGKVVTSYNSVLSDTTKERVHDSNNWSIIVLLIVIILAVITFVFRGSIKKRILSLFLILFFVFGVYQGANASVIVWESATTTPGISSTITAQFSNFSRAGQGGSSIFLPGDQFTVIGESTINACNNATGLKSYYFGNTTLGNYFLTQKTGGTYVLSVGVASTTASTSTFDFIFPKIGCGSGGSCPTSGLNYFSTSTIGNYKLQVRVSVYAYSQDKPFDQREGYMPFTVAGVVLKANGSTGPITVDYNSPVTLSWTSAGISTTSEAAGYPTGCKVISGNGWSEGQATTSSGITINNLIATSTYKLECYVNASLGTTTSSVLVNVRPAPTYTVSFNSQGGTAVSPIAEIPFGSTITLPTEPAKLGFDFDGWWEAENGEGTQFTATTPVTANVTVHAKWTAVPPTTYTITFDSQGGTPVSPITGIPSGSTITLPDNPTKATTPSTFGGWYTAVNGGGTEFTATTPVIASIPVYAKWSGELTVSLTADDYSLPVGASTTLNYLSSNVGSGSCNINNESVSKDISSTRQTDIFNATGTFSFTLTCGNSLGATSTASVSILVLEDSNLNLTCCATRGSLNCDGSVVVNNIMTWKISGLPETETSATVSYTIDGFNFGPTTYSVNAGVINIPKIYTTVGQKDFFATATTTPGLKTGICSTTTTVIQEGGGVIEF